MTLADRARDRLAAASGQEDLERLLRRLDALEEAVAEQQVLEPATAADLDDLVDKLVERATRGPRGGKN